MRKLIFIPLLLMLACQSGDWQETRSFEAAGGWAERDTLGFTYNNARPGTHSLALQLDFSTEYPYQNIWVKLFITDPQGRDTSLLLGDTLMDMAGVWLDHPEPGSHLEWDWQPMPRLSLHETGTYHLKLIQYMREEKLEGIRQVKAGLR